MEDAAVRRLHRGGFPPLLGEIPDPPDDLFIWGEAPDWSRTLLTVVGSRAHTPYGQAACESIISGLSGSTVTIVSGLALGIDAIAHRAAMKAGLPTIAVPGSGLGRDVLYPASHRSLALSIVEAGGALISEFEPSFKATGWSFPRRNRIMAGMSRATLVVEAEKKSGTLITARLALDYNREVFVVPGPIFSALSLGPFELMRHGAHPIASARDLLQILGLETSSEGPRTRRIDFDSLSPDERRIAELLVEPLPRDEIIRALGLPASETNILLTAMELKGLLIETMGEMRLA